MGLKVGDRVPFFLAKDSNGNSFEMRDYINQPVVIYFYPKDDTRICTEQACSFRDNYQEFAALGAEVIGISADSVQSHVKFKSKYNLPFILLSDHGNKIRKAFGVKNDLLIIPGRETYVTDKNGFIQMIFNSSKDGEAHIIRALEMLKKMQ